MILFFLLFTPAAFATCVFYYLLKAKMSSIDFIAKTLCFSLPINIIVWAVIWLFGKGDIVLAEPYNVSFCLKYTLLSFAAATITAIAAVVLKKNISFSISVISPNKEK